MKTKTDDVLCRRLLNPQEAGGVCVRHRPENGPQVLFAMMLFSAAHLTPEARAVGVRMWHQP